jgi:hypothetical protein
LFSEPGLNDVFVVIFKDLIVKGHSQLIVFEVHLILKSVHELGDFLLDFGDVNFGELTLRLCEVLVKK